MIAEKSHTGRSYVLVGGAGLAAWWLLSRGNGWGFRTSSGSRPHERRHHALISSRDETSSGKVIQKWHPCAPESAWIEPP